MNARATLIPLMMAALISTWGGGAEAATASQVASGVEQVGPNTLKAQDINDFRMGMTFAEVDAKTRLTSLGGGDYEADAGGVHYDFGFGPRGHLYRIDSTQKLGKFTPDDAFMKTLRAKLVAKYGEPSVFTAPTNELMWSYAETYSVGEMKLRRQTESLTALVEEGDAGPELWLKLLDFRVLWADQAAQNLGPSTTAGQGLRF